MRRFSTSSGIELAVALLAFGFFLMQVFQTVLLVRQSQTLATIAANQEAPIAETTHLRQAADVLGSAVADLAQHGDVNAKHIVDEMAQLHVKLHPSQAPAIGTAPAK